MFIDYKCGSGTICWWVLLSLCTKLIYVLIRVNYEIGKWRMSEKESPFSVRFTGRLKETEQEVLEVYSGRKILGACIITSGSSVFLKQCGQILPSHSCSFSVLQGKLKALSGNILSFEWKKYKRWAWAGVSCNVHTSLFLETANALHVTQHTDSETTSQNGQWENELRGYKSSYP